jgi:Holliday junction DNA helicase RuvB
MATMKHIPMAWAQEKPGTQEINHTVGITNRPKCLDDFIWQDDIKRVVNVAMSSSRQAWHPLWHILFSWSSGFGKTTLAQLIAHQQWWRFHQITWYALSKPSELISLLHTLQSQDFLFIDEIHRLKATLEEVLYIAMEDYCVDMMLPDGSNIRLSLPPFTLLGATTKPESLSTPLKNRFIYKFHLQPYTPHDIDMLVTRYLSSVSIQTDSPTLQDIAHHVVPVPREIANFCRMIKDYLIVSVGNLPSHLLDYRLWQDFLGRSKTQKGGLWTLHLQYLLVLQQADGKAVWLKTLATHLWVHPDALETDIEPHLVKLWKIEKTPQWRKLL